MSPIEFFQLRLRRGARSGHTAFRGRLSGNFHLSRKEFRPSFDCGNCHIIPPKRTELDPQTGKHYDFRTSRLREKEEGITLRLSNVPLPKITNTGAYKTGGQMWELSPKSW